MTTLNEKCRHCGKPFSYPSAGGRRRRYCSDECMQVAKVQKDRDRRSKGDLGTRLIGDGDETSKAHCDLVVARAAHLMAGDFKAPTEMIIDRFLTYATAQAVRDFGAEHAIRMLNHAAVMVENGVFAHVTAPTEPLSKPH